jgi:excisionase family DNA binding protein
MARPRRRETETSALFVRIPAVQAQKLDQAAYATKTPKSALVSSLVARYVDPENPGTLTELSAQEESGLGLGRHSFRPAEGPEVLTLGQLAEFLQLDEDEARALAELGRLPGRKLGKEWRFSRRAVLDWLAGGEAPEK